MSKHLPLGRFDRSVLASLHGDSAEFVSIAMRFVLVLLIVLALPWLFGCAKAQSADCPRDGAGKCRVLMASADSSYHSKRSPHAD